MATAAPLGWDAPSRLFEAALTERRARAESLAQTPKLARYRAGYLDVLTLWVRMSRSAPEGDIALAPAAPSR